jgi:hypothetical protein
MMKQSFASKSPSIRTRAVSAQGGEGTKTSQQHGVEANENVRLFRNDRSRFVGGQLADYEGENIRAIVNAAGLIRLETSTINHSDARIFGYGELRPVVKRSSSYPDLRGYLDDPEGEYRYEISAWWRTTRVEQKYLSLSMKKVHGAPRAAGKIEDRDVETEVRDPESVKIVREQLEVQEAARAQMIAANILAERKDQAGLLALGYNRQEVYDLLVPDMTGSVGLPRCVLANASETVLRLKRRMEELAGSKSSKIAANGIFEFGEQVTLYSRLRMTRPSGSTTLVTVAASVLEIAPAPIEV